MKTIIFVVLIIASASYLAVGEKSPLSVSADGSTLSVDIEKVSSDVSKQLNEQFAQQLSSFKNEMVQNQQRQIEALQQSVVNLAQKSAQLERKLEQKLEQKLESKLVSTSQAYQPAPVSESKIAQSHQRLSAGPDVGSIKKPVDFDNINHTEHVAADLNDDSVSDSQAIVQVNEVADSSSDMAMMDKQQRRKRLQSLSERMTLKSLGVEK